MKIVIFRLRRLCGGLLYRIALIADFLLNSMHWTIHTNLKQNYRYITSNNNYKYYKSHAKSDMYLQKSNYSVSSQSLHIMWFSLLWPMRMSRVHPHRVPPSSVTTNPCDNQPRFPYLLQISWSLNRIKHVKQKVHNLVNITFVNKSFTRFEDILKNLQTEELQSYCVNITNPMFNSCTVV